ncbi:MAG: M14 family zinc carboxypeptidase [Bacteroidales bacterium]|nr:M14 family zinc carboxypeptidase [Bacteroidales bacterium]
MLNVDSMFQQYPELITEKQPVNDMTSIEGRPIYYLKISDNPNVDEDEPEVLYTSLTHAREPGGMMVLIFYMYHLLENYDTDPEIQQIVDNTELYFVPVVNPDGYIYNQENDPNGGGMWRKNRRNNGNGSYGVDLNRNYGYMWGYDDEGLSGNPWDATYRGTEPFSEPETTVIKDFCESHEFGIALNYHTYSNLWLYTWGYTEEPCEDDELLYAYAEQMTQVNNYEFGPGSTTIYPSNGGSDDWMYGEQETKNKILSFTPEVGNSLTVSGLRRPRIIPHCQENLLANILTAKFTGHYAVAEDLEPSIIEVEEGFLNFRIKRLGLAEDADYTVSVEPLSDNIATVGDPVVFEELELMETKQDSIAFTLAENTPEGDSVVYVLSVDDGYSVRHDTLYKVFGTPVSIYDNNITTLGDFVNDGWGITDEDYVSEDHSITDSPYTDYYNNQFNTIMIADTIDLTQASYALLSFNAKWEIEAGYDYVQVQVSADDGESWSPLEGQYTKTGTFYQQDGEPVYDGFQTDWITEEIALTAFLGEKILIRFVFESDQYTTEDGFYFDDLLVSIIEQLSTEMEPEMATQNKVTVYPSPADEYAVCGNHRNGSAKTVYPL